MTHDQASRLALSNDFSFSDLASGARQHDSQQGCYDLVQKPQTIQMVPGCGSCNLGQACGCHREVVPLSGSCSAGSAPPITPTDQMSSQHQHRFDLCNAGHLTHCQTPAAAMTFFGSDNLGGAYVLALK